MHSLKAFSLHSRLHGHALGYLRSAAIALAAFRMGSSVLLADAANTVAVVSAANTFMAPLTTAQKTAISFGKTLVHIRALWLVLAAGQGMLDPKQQAAMSRKAMKLIAEMALPKRRKRTCPRALRQPVKSWPRLIENTYSTGATEYQLTAILA